MNSLGLLGQTTQDALRSHIEKVLTPKGIDTRHLGLQVQPTLSSIVVTSVDIATDGSYGRYKGSATVSYQKASINDALLYVVTYRGRFPCTLGYLINRLYAQHGIVIEDSDFDFPLNHTFNYSDLTVGGLLELTVSRNSGRWLEGGVLRIRVESEKRLLENAVPTDSQFYFARVMQG